MAVDVLVAVGVGVNVLVGVFVAVCFAVFVGVRGARGGVTVGPPGVTVPAVRQGPNGPAKGRGFFADGSHVGNTFGANDGDQSVSACRRRHTFP